MHKFSTYLILPLVLKLAVDLPACGETPRAPRHAPEPFTIIWGSGGGFTGFADGYILRSDGALEKWSGPYFRRDKVQPLGKVSAASLDSVRRVLAKHDLRQIRYRETGNMTTSLWLISGNDTTIMSWNGITPGEEVPATLKELYRNLSLAADSAR